MRIADELQIDCPRFYIDNVAEYFGAEYPSGTKGLLVNDLPQIVPPFPVMWMEYYRVRDDVPPFSVATKISTETLQPRAWPIKWCMEIEGYESTPSARGKVFKSKSKLLAFLDETGALQVAVNSDAPMDRMSGPTWWNADGCKQGQGLRLITPMFLALSFMSCKNVRHVEHIPGGKLEKARLKRGRKPTLRYYTLEIDPMREVLRREGHSDTLGLKQAMHICRGHFKDYRQSGLFGKIKGVFWWDQAVRGTAEAGVVVKDYSVKAPT